MDFKTAARLGGYLSKDYAQDFFKLLVNYQDISASEAASRLGLHIRTAQDFLEGLTELDILHKEEVYEKKRPYYRYSLVVQRITLEIDLSQIEKRRAEGDLAKCIREQGSAQVNFSLSRDGESISSVSFWKGNGRDRKEQRISLTGPQGAFLYHLPFPKAEFLSIASIMHKAGLEERLAPEILDIVELLENNGIIEVEYPHLE